MEKGMATDKLKGIILEILSPAGITLNGDKHGTSASVMKGFISGS